ncbi:MAG: squalene/phytoene synthase family protein, partial [Acidobacteriaceae bacterium]|nr:squalene/phytoene synthase family protein [Acidobacteriaceae bacterium]
MRAATQLTLEPLYARAASVTADHSKSFYFATRFFPPHLARSAHAVYWFCRYTDDLVDECSDPEQGRRELDRWAAEIEHGFAHGFSEHPVLIPFLDAQRRHRIPREYARELIVGMRMDLNNTRYRN